jgi:hypothetical protein
VSMEVRHLAILAGLFAIGSVVALVTAEPKWFPRWARRCNCGGAWIGHARSCPRHARQSDAQWDRWFDEIVARIDR